MKDPLLVLGAIMALALFYVMLPVFLDVLMRYRKATILMCPQKNKEASVGIDATRAALSSLFGQPQIRLKDCTLLHNGQHCNLECLKSIIK